MDYGHQYADKKISAVDRELKKTYRTAQKQLKEKLADFEKQFARKNKEKKKMLEAGEITQDEYRDWMTGQVFVRSRWQEQQRMINAVLLDHNRQAMNIVQNSTFDVFAENYNYNAYLAEQKMIGTFNLYNAEAVARLILGDPQLLPEWDIDKKKDYIWNQQKVNNILRQSIIQGKTVEEITQDLADGLATKNYNRMRLFARTAITEAESAGRQQQMNDAAEMGIEVKKMWIATHDNRTRDAHRGLDGDTVPYNEPFHSSLGDIMRPGDPSAAPANVYNCRCTMQTIYPKYDQGTTREETIDGQSYEEWKKGKKKRGEVVESDEKPKAISREEYLSMKEKRDEVYEREKAKVEKWFETECDKEIEKYGGDFTRQRIAIKHDDTLTDEEKERKLDEVEEKRAKYKEKRNELAEQRNDRLKEAMDKRDYTFEPKYEYKQIEGELNTAENAKAVNPNWHALDFEYTHNCQRCAVAFELRERGCDVEAMGAPQYGGMGAEAEIKWLFSAGESYDTDCFGHQTTLDVRDKMKQWGDGSRAIVVIKRSNGMSGHAFNVEYKNDEFYIVDSQAGACWTDKKTGDSIDGGCLEEPWTSHVTLYRTDGVKMRSPSDGWIKSR